MPVVESTFVAKDIVPDVLVFLKTEIEFDNQFVVIMSLLPSPSISAIFTA